MSRNVYPLEFRREVVRLVTEEHKGAREALTLAATKFGIDLPVSYTGKNAGSHVHRFRSQVNKLDGVVAAPPPPRDLEEDKVEVEKVEEDEDDVEEEAEEAPEEESAEVEEDEVDDEAEDE